eukprot:1523475-Pyramimonas_sp.AAC.1
MVWTEAISDAAFCVHHSFCGEGSREKFICSSPGPNDNFIWQCGDNGASGRGLGGPQEGVETELTKKGLSARTRIDVSSAPPQDVPK